MNKTEKLKITTWLTLQHKLNIFTNLISFDFTEILWENETNEWTGKFQNLTFS